MDDRDDIEKTGISVVFEHTEGHARGGRYIVFYPNRDEVDKVRQELDADPEARKKIIATGLPLAEAQQLCDEALKANIGNMLDSIANDQEMNPLVKQMEVANLLFALGARLGNE